MQRIPETESSGRIHTSTVTVAVLAEAEDVDIEVPASDLKIDVYKSAGAGGQNVQKNATAIRITPQDTVDHCRSVFVVIKYAASSVARGIPDEGAVGDHGRSKGVVEDCAPAPPVQ